jgi:type IV secretion system protein VirB11
LKLFADEEVVEVYANGDLAVRTDGAGGRQETGLALPEEAVRGFLNIAATREEISLGGEGSCEIASELPAEIFGKARLQGMVPPLVERASFVIRKHPARILLFPELVASGSVSPDQYRVFRQALAAGESLIVSGATKSGKTNLVNALLHELVAMRPGIRVVLLEDTPEIVCPARDTLRMVTVETRVDLHDLVRIGVRCHPDVFVVGEVRGRDAYPFLDSMAACARSTRGARGLDEAQPPGPARRLGRVPPAWVGSAPRVLEIVRIAGWLDGRGYELERLA